MDTRMIPHPLFANMTASLDSHHEKNMSAPHSRDRYITFEGLDCDANASRIVTTIRQAIDSDALPDKWTDYFSKKLQEKERLGVDDLFFIGSQVNTIYALLEEIDDQETHELLYQVEQECC